MPYFLKQLKQLMVRFSLLSESVFDFYRIARDVFATLAQKEPDKHKDRTSEYKQSILNWRRPVSSKQNEGIDHAEADSVKISARQHDFFSKREITFSKRILGAVVWVTKKLTIENEL